MTKPEPKKTKGMCIATRCTSVEQFIQMFHRFVDEESFFVSTLNTRPPGLETSFSVQLVDGTPVLRGLCTVMQAWSDAQNPFKTPGVRLGIKRLTANSMLVFEQLLIARSASKQLPAVTTSAGVTPPPPPTPKPGTAAPQAIAPVTTKPGGLVAPKLPFTPPKSIVVPVIAAAPRPMATSPFTETAPTKSAQSRLELKQPARPSSEPAARRAVSEPIPEPISAEPTDALEEKTDVREPKKAVTQLEPSDAPEPVLRPSRPAIAEPPGVVDPSIAAAPDLPSPLADDSRTPGSELVLPANPLQNLTDESLEGYVDCTLYEETGNFFPVDDDPSVIVDDVIPPPVLASRSGASHEPRQRTITPLPAVPDSSGFDANPDTELAAKKFETAPKAAAYEPPGDDAVAARGRDSSPSLVVPPSMPAPPMPRESVMVDPALVARGSAPAVDRSSFDTPTKPTPPPGGLKADGLPLPAPALSNDRLTPTPHKRPRWWLLGGAVGLLATAVIVVVITTSSSVGGSPTPAKPAPAAKPPTQVASVEAPKPVDGPTPEEAAEDPPSGEGPPTVGSGPCKVVVATTPAGSIVQLDGTSVGPTPITVAASCDKHKLDVSHARYQPMSKLVTLTEGNPQQVELTLSRPTHIVTVTSNPPGATIFIDGRSAGTTPSKLSVLGFVTLKLEFKKTGYQPASAKLYSRVPQDNVAVRLTKW